jgi:acyl carrier protein
VPAAAERVATSVRTREEIHAQVQDLLCREFAVDPSRAVPEARLLEDLDLDSIDLVALAMDLERELGFLLQKERLRRLRTIRDVVEWVVELETPTAAVRRRE